MLKVDKSIRARYYGGYNNEIKAIVFHYTANTGMESTAKRNAVYFSQTTEKASAHYIVDEGKTVYESVPLTNAAWAVGDAKFGTYGGKIGNYNSISIEMVSHTDKNGKYFIPEQTMENAVELYWMLKQKYPNAIPLRHYDISGKPCPQPLIDARAWAEFKERIDDFKMDGKTIYEKLNAYLEAQPVPAWAKSEIEQAKKMGITDGSNMTKLIPRYQAAIMAKRAAEAAAKK